MRDGSGKIGIMDQAGPQEYLELVVGVASAAIGYRNQQDGLVNEVLVYDGPLVAQGHRTYLGPNAEGGGDG